MIFTQDITLPLLGHLWLAVQEDGTVTAVQFHTTEAAFHTYLTKLTNKTHITPDTNQHTLPLQTQLSQYAHRTRQTFDLPLAWQWLTPFQQQVLHRVQTIPYGRLLTYQNIAQELGNPNAICAVGRANATNPIPILIPCHRVIGSDGKLHGYAGGLERKAALLQHEGSWLL